MPHDEHSPGEQRRGLRGGSVALPRNVCGGGGGGGGSGRAGDAAGGGPGAAAGRGVPGARVARAGRREARGAAAPAAVAGHQLLAARRAADGRYARARGSGGRAGAERRQVMRLHRTLALAFAFAFARGLLDDDVAPERAHRVAVRGLVGDAGGGAGGRQSDAERTAGHERAVRREHQRRVRLALTRVLAEQWTSGATGAV